MYQQYNKSISGVGSVRCSAIVCLCSGHLYNKTTCKLEMLLRAFTGDNTVPFQTSFVIHALVIQLFFWCSYLKNVGSNDVNVTCVLGT
jgi:hypothetical protein